MASYFKGLKLNHCNFCMKKYFINDMLTEHMITAHNMTTEDVEPSEQEPINEYTNNVYENSQTDSITVKHHQYTNNVNENSHTNNINVKHHQYTNNVNEEAQRDDRPEKRPHIEIVRRQPKVEKGVDAVNPVFTCYICLRVFKKSVALSIHMAVVHSKKKNKKNGNITKYTYKCNICPMKFNSEIQMLNHDMQSHEGSQSMTSSQDYNGSGAKETKSVAKLNCSRCNREFKSQKILDLHMEYHTGFEIYKCEKCDYSAQNKYDLQSHFKKDHLGFSLHTCKICLKNFTQKSSLYRHKMLHTGEKPFACDACSYRSNNKSNLRGHMKTHTGNRPFSCPFCYKPFTLKSRCDLHIASEHSSRL